MNYHHYDAAMIADNAALLGGKPTRAVCVHCQWQENVNIEDRWYKSSRTRNVIGSNRGPEVL